MRQQLLEGQQRIRPYIHRTPVLSSRLLNKAAGAELFFKCENFQKTGSYKVRGATNAVMQLTDAEKQRGVVTHSSGNFAQAVARAAQAQGIPAYIVMPSTAPLVKKEAVRTYGGQISECAPTLQAREQTAQEIVKSKGAALLHPSNQLSVIMGQATVAMELIEEQSNLEAIIAPVGGGGLIAGTCLASHYFGFDCPVIGGEPFAVDDAYRSLESGRIESNTSTDTIADGLKTQLGDVNFPIIQRHVDRIIRVTEAEIVSAMRLMWERLKIVCEPSSAVAFAALLSQKDDFADQRVGIIVSGGNVDVGKLAALFGNT